MVVYLLLRLLGTTVTQLKLLCLYFSIKSKKVLSVRIYGPDCLSLDGLTA